MGMWGKLTTDGPDANYVAPDGEQPHTDDAEGCAHPDLAQIDNT